MRISELFHLAGVQAALLGDGDVTDLTADSRTVEKGAFFVCMPSRNTASHQFLPDAVKRGAVGALAHSEEGLDLARQAGLAACCIADERLFRETVGRLAKTFFGNPSGTMQVVGVTGTNGKTTTAWMLRDMFGSLGVRSAYLGTLGFHLRGIERTLENTTPFAIDVQRMLQEALQMGVWSVAMEVSSHALEERRVDGIEFDVGVFTNLSQDHLDFHGTMAAYEASKRRLFEDLPRQSKKPFVAAINTDDGAGERIAADFNGGLVTYGLNSGQLRGIPLSVELDKIVIELRYQGASERVTVGLGGQFNVYNCLSAAAGFLATGHDLESTAKALEVVRPVPGRFEAVPNHLGIGVIVDYAHTPDALVKLLESVRSLGPSRIITVFGCGGDRDRQKRPLMAAAVSERSELTVLTSDNPRTEEPEAILAEVAAGVAPGSDAIQIIDRREAIAEAIRRAKKGDIVVVAGKGHENYQIIGRTKYPMDDRAMAKAAMEALS